MKAFILSIFALLFVVNSNGQVVFSPVKSQLKATKRNNITNLSCSSSNMSVKFLLNGKVAVLPQNNMVTINGQIIQITPVKFSGQKPSSDNQVFNTEMNLLEKYASYELDYFKNELRTDVLDPSNQWVKIKSKGWFIWYFKVGQTPVEMVKPIKTQLFASTIVGDNILTINAPVIAGGDFKGAALIVNEMMENIMIAK